MDAFQLHQARSGSNYATAPLRFLNDLCDHGKVNYHSCIPTVLGVGYFHKSLGLLRGHARFEIRATCMAMPSENICSNTSSRYSITYGQAGIWSQKGEFLFYSTSTECNCSKDTEPYTSSLCYAGDQMPYRNHQIRFPLRDPSDAVDVRRPNRLHNRHSIVSEIDNLFGGANSAGCVELLV